MTSLDPMVYAAAATACVLLALIAIPGLKAEGFKDLEHDAPAAQGKQRGLAGLVERLSNYWGPRLISALGAGRRSNIERRLDLAGRPGGLTVEGYIGRQAAYVTLGILAGVFLLAIGGGWVFPLLFATAGYVLPEMSLSRTGRTRQEQIDRDLPDFLDILAVTVRAGLGYRLALQRVSESLGGPVGEEMVTALRQMGLGVDRREAFERLRSRNDSEPLKSFVAAQLQAEELGVPLADALNDIAVDMRRFAHQAARRRAQQAAPRVSLVTTTLIVPASVILLLVSLVLGSGTLDNGLF